VKGWLLDIFINCRGRFLEATWGKASCSWDGKEVGLNALRFLAMQGPTEEPQTETDTWKLLVN